MPRWTEIELKLGLPDEAAWRFVRDRLADAAVVTQTNHFFDNAEGSLRAARIGCRLREEAGAWTLTLKGEGSTGPGRTITERVELETPIDPEAAARMVATGLDLGPRLTEWRDTTAGSNAVAAVLSQLESVAASPLVKIGAFTNERTRGMLDALPDVGPIAIELDRTTFGAQRTDYEIEVEFTDDGPRPDAVAAALTSWLAREGGVRPFPAESKLARFQSELTLRDGGG